MWRKGILLFCTLFALSSCADFADFVDNPETEDEGTDDPKAVNEAVAESAFSSTEGEGSGSPPPIEVQLAGICEEDGGCPCYEFENDPVPGDRWACNPENGIAYDCWVKEGSPMIITTQQFCTGSGWECGYKDGNPGCEKTGQSSGYIKRFTINLDGTYTECFGGGSCPSGAEILDCYQGPDFHPWDGDFHLFCSGNDTCGRLWKEIEGNEYCICEQEGKADECRSCEEGLMDKVVADPCELYAPEEEEIPSGTGDCGTIGIVGWEVICEDVKAQEGLSSCKYSCCEEFLTCLKNTDCAEFCWDNHQAACDACDGF